MPTADDTDQPEHAAPRALRTADVQAVDANGNSVFVDIRCTNRPVTSAMTPWLQKYARLSIASTACDLTRWRPMSTIISDHLLLKTMADWMSAPSAGPASSAWLQNRSWMVSLVAVRERRRGGDRERERER